MSNIKVKIDTPVGQTLLVNLLSGMSKPGGIIDALDLECLVLIAWYKKSMSKLYFGTTPLTIRLQKHEAVSLDRVLMGLDIQNDLTDIARNQICNEIQIQVPEHCPCWISEF